MRSRLKVETPTTVTRYLFCLPRCIKGGGLDRAWVAFPPSVFHPFFLSSTRFFLSGRPSFELGIVRAGWVRVVQYERWLWLLGCVDL